MDRAAPRKEEPRRAMIGYGDFDTVMGVVAKAVAKGPYLMGEQFTAADVVVERQQENPAVLSTVLSLSRRLYDYTLVDMSQTIDDFNLQLFDEADVIYVIMTADLSCLKNVRLVLETMDSLGYEKSKVQLVLNRSNAYTGINVSNAESALGRKIDYQVINEYRGAISALNSGEPFMSSRADAPLSKSVLAFAKALDEGLRFRTGRCARPPDKPCLTRR